MPEQGIAERLRRLLNGTLPWPAIDPEKALPWAERQTGLALVASQVAAIRLALVSKVLVITGGPGVGKTTIVKAILRILAAKGVGLLLCAPTGRAAKRMTEATGYEAKTIHRLLEVDPKAGGFKRNGDNPLACDLLVVDETSMVDVLLMQALMKAVPDHAGLLIVGDIDQLPSVGPGQVLADLIASGAVPVVRLTEGLPPGGAEPDYYQCPSDQPGGHSGSVQTGGRQRLLLCRGERPRRRRAADRRTGEGAHPPGGLVLIPSATSRCCVR
jgi:exodeoxyribonuclease V alpha subunit